MEMIMYDKYDKYDNVNVMKIDWKMKGGKGQVNSIFSSKDI